MTCSASRVRISGSTAIVGAPFESTTKLDSGAAYIFERNTGGVDQWGQVKMLKASTPGLSDLFGSSVGISGSTIIVGARLESTAQASSGAAYIFERNTGGADQWGQVKMLKASTPGQGDEFGYAVGISGSTVIVGAHFEDTTQTDSGASYIFERNMGGR